MIFPTSGLLQNRPHPKRMACLQFGRLTEWGEDPMESVAGPCHLVGMKTLISLVMLPFFFAGSGFFLAGLIGGVVGLILLICLILQLTGGFHTRSKPSGEGLSPRETTGGHGADGSVG